jgi:acyl carrier protein
MVISLDDIAGTIERFIRREFRVMNNDDRFSRGVHLYDSGYVDSVGVVELIAFIESAFSVALRDEHIFSERFTTIDGISSVVASCVTEKNAADDGNDGAREVLRAQGDEEGVKLEILEG